MLMIVRTQLSAEDQLGATDFNCAKIASIDVLDSLGYRGCGREEHSGENAPVTPDDLRWELADNRRRQM
jgi:hypothetical protein